MIDVVSVKFKNRGKCYFFDPGELSIVGGDKLVVETSKGLELADCCRGKHSVSEDAVIQPLRPVIRIATADDLRVAELNAQREKEAFDICRKKIEEHKLDMKLVDVECNFEGTKTMFFFTSDGRVDFRDLVKDLAGIFRNRIELRQIGVRDEAKMIGGIGICGRPYCCNQFLDDFQPVSTKMAKMQSLSLNPTKISGSCGRLMCCLRYEQEAYEDLLKKVPKQGAFVETKDGFGTAVQINLLRQNVKVKLDNDGDDSLRVFKTNELITVPGGRPKDGEAPVSTFVYIPEPEESVEEKEPSWEAVNIAAVESAEQTQEHEERRPSRRGRAKSRRIQHERREKHAPSESHEVKEKSHETKERSHETKERSHEAKEKPQLKRIPHERKQPVGIDESERREPKSRKGKLAKARSRHIEAKPSASKESTAVKPTAPKESPAAKAQKPAVHSEVPKPKAEQEKRRPRRHYPKHKPKSGQ